jgi:methionyl-tRNA formyltransferase
MIGATETAGELHDRLARICCDAIGAALDLLENQPDCPGEPQDDSRATTAKKLKKSDGYLDFTAPAERLALLVRAMWPLPGARCRYVPAASGGKPVELTLITATAVPKKTSESPGVITPLMTVATGQGELEIHSVQPAGSRAMSWQEFVNGRRTRAGDRMESIEA